MVRGKQDGRAGTGSQHIRGGVRTAAYMRRLNIRALKGRCATYKLLMETEAEGNQWCASRVGMSSSSPDGLLGPSVPPVPWQGGGREAEVQEILLSHRSGY